MKVHHLKTAPEFFQAVWEDRKTAELRFDDRGFEVGDTLVLQEYDRQTEVYSGRTITAAVTHILSDYPGMTQGYVMLSISVSERKDKDND